jgi:tRNA (guanine37-N1)-methyltransferase
MFPGPLSLSLAGQALARGHWKLETVDMRAFAGDRHRSVDDAPFGGGPGMVMRPDVVDAAVAASMRPVRASAQEAQGIEGALASAEAPSLPLIHLTPRGRPLDQKRVRELAAGPGVVLLCGRYEGIDERALERWELEEISLGDFVLSGGEPAAIALIDACVRLLPGVVGSATSLAEESFEQGLLEHPQYTRPRVWRGRDVPAVLLSGHHEKVREWRRSEAERVTKTRRPDLWARYVRSAAGRHITRDDLARGDSECELATPAWGPEGIKESVP